MSDGVGNAFVVSKAANAKFDIREDEEQYVKLQEALELLVAAGYFRARIKGLSAFDKIVGGLVWCISTCRVAVDVDLFYSDNSTIGQKIALTERIVAILPKIKCPHSLEPHQIQGLDFIHIFPVVQFLVKKAIEAAEIYGDEVHKHSVYQFDTRHALPAEDESMEATASSQKLSARAVVELVDRTGLESIVEKYKQETTSGRETLGSTIEELNAHLTELNDAMRLMEADEEMQEAEDAVAQAEYEAARRSLDEARAAHGTTHSLQMEEVVERLRMLLDEHDSIRKREAEFKNACRVEMAEMEAELQRLQQPRDQQVDIEALRAAVAEADAALAAKRLEAAVVTREIASLQRQIDRVPSQIELTQYQRRFVELYNLMASKHSETKQHYTLHNTLIDVRNYMKREIDLLNSIDDNKELTSKDKYKESFLDNLQTILKGVDDSLDKLSTRRKGLQAQRDDAYEILQHLLEKQRLFHKTVNEFKLECQRNEQLLSQLQSRGIAVDDE